MVISLIGEQESLDYILNLVMPLLTIFLIISVWQGIYRHRWTLAIVCLYQGGKTLAPLIYAMVHLAMITPPDQSDFFLNFVIQLFLRPLLYSCFFILVGLLVLLLPSLKAFIKYQSESENQGWLGRFIRPEDKNARHKLMDLIDALHEAREGGPPTTVENHLGDLPVPSGTLVLGDPQDLPSIEIPNINSDVVSIFAKFLQYPSGLKTMSGLVIAIGTDEPTSPRKKIGNLAIDSARVVVADEVDIEEHWSDTDLERIGVISTEEDDLLLRELEQRFHLEAVQVNSTHAEVQGPISEAMEAEIEEYLLSEPRYAEFSYRHFHVQSENSFDRVNDSDQGWEFLPISKVDSPKMFISSTGHGDGCYDVFCEYKDDRPVKITIDFMGEE
ncbi:MAG: hypothetical protein COA78_03750 [Blastopirellula sp.]|nr:MAG: hypothetical protein COA78_03750 [Blastopirellula sp.]